MQLEKWEQTEEEEEEDDDYAERLLGGGRMGKNVSMPQRAGTF